MKLVTLAATAATAAACSAGLAAPASANIVKAPLGESSQLNVLSSTQKTLKRHKVSLARTGPAKRKRSSFSMAYSLSRWDFAAREGDVAHFTKNTGFRFRRAGGRSVAMVHPRVIVDGRRGYITGLISNVRVKTFTFKMSDGRVTDTASRQRITGLRLKLTKASAQYVNRGLRRRVLRPFTRFGTLELNILKPSGSNGDGSPAGGSAPAGQAPGQGTNPGGTVSVSRTFASQLPADSQFVSLAPGSTVDADGDGRPDAGVFAYPLRSASFDSTTRTGTIQLDGGFAVQRDGQNLVTLDDPQIVIGATPETSGLYVLVNGVRTKVGDLDPNAVDVRVADGTVTLSNLDATLSAEGATALTALLGTPVLPGGELVSFDLSLPQA